MSAAKPPLTVAEEAIIDFQKGLDALARRAMTLDMKDPTLAEFNEYDLRSFGQAVRFEIDCTQPIPSLKRELNTIRAVLANCLVLLEQNASGNTRRRMVHSELGGLRDYLKRERKDRKDREARQPVQPT